MTTLAAAARVVLRRLDLAADDRATRRDLRSLVRRGALPDRTVRDGARAIVDDVAVRGADAVREANRRFGGGLGDGRLLVGRPELASARDVLAPSIREALEAAAANVDAFARTQRPASTRTRVAPGVEIERRWSPVDAVGGYVPGGSAPLPSSLVMTVVPARVAGVGRIVVATPARADGTLDPVVAGAAGLLGVDAVLVAGGAQAIAALAFGLGSESGGRDALDREPVDLEPVDLEPVDLEPVDLVVGPGNAWVTAAKLEVSAVAAIDLPAGPSEGLVLADEGADPSTVAADLLTQAEHGPDSPAILVTTSVALADAVEVAIAGRLPALSRRDVLARALADRGRIVLAPSLHAAVAWVNAYAPEHLSVDVVPLEETVAAIRSAGSVFVGRWAPESAGDYATGANHVLPTGGLARGRGPLAVETFGSYSQVQRITREGLASLRGTIETLATAEGLDAHAAAVAGRFDRAGDGTAR